MRCQAGSLIARPGLWPWLGLYTALETDVGREMTVFSIGQLAKRAEVAIDTVRYYERIGLMRPAARLSSGYRRYGETELRRLWFIRRAKALGFSLDEIEELLVLDAGRNGEQARRRAISRMEDIERRIAELARIRDGLHQLVAACAGRGRTEPCPILDALARPAGK